MDWFVDCHQSLRGNTHREENLPGVEDVPNGVEEVREQVLIYQRVNVHGKYKDEVNQNQNINDCKHDQALVEC